MCDAVSRMKLSRIVYCGRCRTLGTGFLFKECCTPWRRMCCRQEGRGWGIFAFFPGVRFCGWWCYITTPGNEGAGSPKMAISENEWPESAGIDAQNPPSPGGSVWAGSPLHKVTPRLVRIVGHFRAVAVCIFIWTAFYLRNIYL